MRGSRAIAVLYGIELTNKRIVFSTGLAVDFEPFQATARSQPARAAAE